MRESTVLFGFILLIIGTIGLLVNEFIFEWGRLATVRFTILNVAGIVILAVAHWRRKKALLGSFLFSS